MARPAKGTTSKLGAIRKIVADLEAAGKEVNAGVICDQLEADGITPKSRRDETKRYVYNALNVIRKKKAEMGGGDGATTAPTVPASTVLTADAHTNGHLTADDFLLAATISSKLGSFDKADTTLEFIERVGISKCRKAIAALKTASTYAAPAAETAKAE